jgi:hypothetical protein
MFGGGQRQAFVSHIDALCRLVMTMTEPDSRLGSGQPVLAAHPSPITMGMLMRHIGETCHSRAAMIPIPIPLGLVGLRMGEKLRLPLPFRSDSLLALAHPIPARELARMEPSPVQFPVLQSSLWV